MVRQASQLASASLSIADAPPPARRWGLIALVLLADVGLATAGAVMLARGLSEQAKPVAPAKPANVEPKPDPAKSAIAPASAAGSNTIAVAATPTAAARKPATTTHDPKPVDPYALDHDVDQMAAKSQPELDRCLHDASAIAPIHGTIRIAFQIAGSGTVGHSTSVDNTTGSLALANCLALAVAAWTFQPHPGDPIDFVRPFTYP